MKSSFVLVALLFGLRAFAVAPDQKNLPIGLAPWESGRVSAPQPSAPPKGPVHALAEWDEPEAVMTLWTNPSLVSALVKHGPVKLFADGRSDQNWWKRWLKQNNIPDDNVTYFTVATDSIWIRDYGPWPILDGDGNYGLVHNTYNRPRPRDNKVAAYIARTLGVTLFDTGLVHTGGNFYNDGVGDGYSSTLVYSENSSIPENDVNARMQKFLGIDRYLTSPLGKGSTIEHLDTFGKLVAPDTWVFGEFPEGTSYRDDVEEMIAKLRKAKSPYGTPFRIFRVRMVEFRDNYRAYLNSFISNGALYFANYGDEIDEEVKKIYQAALPGHEIIGVDAMGTEWGDSVHCRTRNLIKRDALYLFPRIAQHRDTRAGTSIDVTVEAFPAPGTELKSAPVLHWCGAGICHVNSLKKVAGRNWAIKLPEQPTGSKFSMFVEASDTGDHYKSVPPLAPKHEIEVIVE